MPKKSFLGASSHGKAVCSSVDTCYTGCIEINCLYSIEKTITIKKTNTVHPNDLKEKSFMDFKYFNLEN